MSKFKVGDKLKCVKDVSIFKRNSILTILKVRHDQYGVEYYGLTGYNLMFGWEHNFELLSEGKQEMNDKLNAGMLFRKGDDIFLVADSTNQRWFVNIITGAATWAYKDKGGTISETVAKGYTYMSTTKELLSGSQPSSTPNQLPAPKEVLEDSPEAYRPFSGFDKLLQEKIG